MAVPNNTIRKIASLPSRVDSGPGNFDLAPLGKEYYRASSNDYYFRDGTRVGDIDNDVKFRVRRTPTGTLGSGKSFTEYNNSNYLGSSLFYADPNYHSNNFAFPYDSVIKDALVPIGARGQTFRMIGKADNNDSSTKNADDILIYWKDNLSGTNTIDNNFLSQRIVEVTPKLTNEVSSLCAGGQELTSNNWLKTDNDIKNSYDVCNNTSSSKNNNCYYELKNIYVTDKPSDDYTCLQGSRKYGYKDYYAQRSSDASESISNVYFRGSVDRSTFCQMGDYIDTENDLCANPCSDVKDYTSGTDWCRWSKEKLCSKQIYEYEGADYDKNDPGNNQDKKDKFDYINVLKRELEDGYDINIDGPPTDDNYIRKVPDRNWIADSYCSGQGGFCGPFNLTDKLNGEDRVNYEECLQNKLNYCKNRNQWRNLQIGGIDLTNLESNCKDFFLRNNGIIDTDEVDDACRDILLDNSDKERYIFGNNSCGSLCMDFGENPTLDFDTFYCDNIRKDYCLEQDFNGNYVNMFSDDNCRRFCENKPEICAGNSEDPNDPGLINWCRNYFAGEDGNKYLPFEQVEEGMKTIVNEQAVTTIGDYCGCMLTDDYYDEYTSRLFDAFDEYGYAINIDKTFLNTNPHCIYPACKNGIPINNAMQNTDCVECVQTIDFNALNSNINCNVIFDQVQQCNNDTTIQQDPTSPNYGTCQSQSESTSSSSIKKAGQIFSDSTEGIVLGIVIIVFIVFFIGIFVIYGPAIYKGFSRLFWKTDKTTIASKLI